MAESEKKDTTENQPPAAGPLSAIAERLAEQQKIDASGEKKEQKPTTPESIRANIFKDVRTRVEKYEVFQSEAMEDNAFRSLVATVELNLQKRAKELVDDWIRAHPEEVRERSYGTGQLPDPEKRKLVLEQEGEEYFEKIDPYYEQLAFTLKRLENCNGRPGLRNALFCSYFLADLQQGLEQKLRQNPTDASLKGERSRFLQIQEALHTSFYKKDIDFDKAKAEKDALDDARTSNDLNEFLRETDNSAVLQTKQRSYSGLLTPRQIIALETLGYETKSQTERFLGIWPKRFVGIEIFKDGNLTTINVADIYRQFEEKKKQEIAQKYLDEKVENEKITSFRRSLSEIQRNPEELARLTEDLQRETITALLQKEEMIRLKKDDPTQEKHYREILKEKGENVTKAIEDTLEGGAKNEFFKKFKGENDAELKEFLMTFNQPMEYFDRLSEDERKIFREDLAKAKKGGILRWIFAIFDAISQLEKLAQG